MIYGMKLKDNMTMNKSLITIILSICATLFLDAYTCHQGSVAEQTSTSRHYMKLSVGKASTDNSDNVLRIPCVLIGVPHTSSRVDSIKATVGGKIYKATDIDGIDFNRYFQWEDEAINIEIDFPIKKLPAMQDSIYFYTVHGLYKSPLKR